ncbi:MAG: hypothetical protein F6K40_38440 [Okeania sp. SIO3I5]|uniref:hypothetical protein n=1 Tax=Okeania sp. SIO3I5 TaxID=2607805 RepID=UPI0013BB98DB|nr:hypothetical protein [Okeania sp. SIO3I5]NEQ41751.1 hypothetical protein [Okeania sp. SIO3I5]
MAVWIDLADLQEKTIEEYLLKVWLKNALKVKLVTPELEDALVKLFNHRSGQFLSDR